MVADRDRSTVRRQAHGDGAPEPDGPSSHERDPTSRLLAHSCPSRRTAPPACPDWPIEPEA